MRKSTAQRVLGHSLVQSLFACAPSPLPAHVVTILEHDVSLHTLQSLQLSHSCNAQPGKEAVRWSEGDLDVLEAALSTYHTLWGVAGVSMRVQDELYWQFMLTALEHERTPPDVNEILLAAVVRLLRDGHGAVLYSCYECDVHGADLYSRLVQALCNVVRTHTEPVTAMLASVALDALAALLLEALATPDDNKSVARLTEEREQKRMLREAGEAFNEKPAKGLAHAQALGLLPPGELEATRIAAYLRSNPFVNPKALGEFLGDRKDLSVAVLGAYARQCDMRAERPYLACLRTFLESFRPVGEAGVMDRYIDAFAAAYLETHPTQTDFASHDALFTLTYSLIMLNVELHSPVLADRPKMSLAQYVRNVEDLNDDDKFPRAFLESLYTEIQDDEIKIHREHALRALTAVTYAHLLATPRAAEPLRSACAAPLMYDGAWRPIHAAAAAAVRATRAPELLERGLALLHVSALLAAQCALTAAMDDLVETLAPLSELLALPDPLAVHWGSSERGQVVLVALCTLVRKHMGHVRGGWRTFLQLLCRLHSARLLPQLVDLRSKLPVPAPAPAAPASASTASWFSPGAWFGGAESAPSASTGVSDGVARKLEEQAQRSVQQCKLGIWLAGIGALDSDALLALARALVDRSLDDGDGDGAALCVDLLAHTALVCAPERLSLVWPPVSAHLEHLCTSNAPALVFEHAVMALMVLARELLQYDEIRVSCLQILQFIPKAPQHGDARRLRGVMAAGVQCFLETNLAFLKGSAVWRLVGELLGWLARDAASHAQCLALLVAIVRGGERYDDGADVIGNLGATFVSEDNFALVCELLNELVRSPSSAGPESHDIAQKALAQVHQLVHLVPCWALGAADSALERYWLPLFQQLSSYCVQPHPAPSRLNLRHVALSHMQRALLAPPLFRLDGPQWEAVFENAVFPLLDALLQAPSASADSREEERLRASSIVCKTFLQYLSKLADSASFERLWLRVVAYLERLAASGEHGELLGESITQALKNIILVMHASSFDFSAAPDGWWARSWASIDALCPKLRQELPESVPIPAST